MVNQDLFNRSTILPTFLMDGDPRDSSETFVCYITKTIVDNGVWQEINPLAQSLPIFIAQLIVITSTTRLLIFLLKPLHLPPIIAEIIAGIMMGPSVMWKFRERCPFLATIFSISRIMMLETVGNLGLVYFLFLLGLDIDLGTLSRMGQKPFAIGLAGVIFPFAAGLILFHIFFHHPHQSFQVGSLFWGVCLSVTGLPVVAHILAQLKLLHSDVGRIAMSAAAVNDILSWILLTAAIATSTNGNLAPWVFISIAVFAVICYYVIRPAIVWVFRSTREGEEYSESTICIVLTGVLACGLVTDLLGVSSMVGAFLFGLVIPNDALGHRFVVVLQGFVSDILMSVFFALSGFRTFLNAAVLGYGGKKGSSDWVSTIVLILLLCGAKLGGTFVVSYLYDMPLQEKASLGVLMNTKGLLAIIALNIGRDHTVLDDTQFSIMLIATLIMMIATSPIIRFLYRPTRRFVPSKHRALEKLKSDSELRILTCIHEMQTVAGITNLLKASNPTKKSPLCVFALQLIRLTKNATAMLIIHSPGRFGSQNSRSRGDGQTDKMITTFQNLEGECGYLSIQPLTAMSSYATMHEDVCDIAEDKRVTLIILPFHKRQTIHNKMEEANLAYKEVNDNVLVNAPCSVAILVDRGFGSDHGQNRDKLCSIAMIYIGGPDDREALAYAWRMAGHPKSTLTVVRFLPGENSMDLEKMLFKEKNGVVYLKNDVEEQKKRDNSFVNDFRQRTSNNKSVVYLEKSANNSEETLASIRSMGETHDLYVVGRGLGFWSPLTAGLADWSECPELGALGDMLVTSDFSSTASVLVVQQYTGVKTTGGDGAATPESADEYNEEYPVGDPVDSRMSRKKLASLINQREMDDGY